MPPANLYTILEEVHDEGSFIKFLEALATDWEDGQRQEKLSPSNPYGPGANGWENGSIGQFLEAAAAFAQDSQKDQGDQEQNVWLRFATIIYAGKLYE